MPLLEVIQHAYNDHTKEAKKIDMGVFQIFITNSIRIVKRKIAAALNRNREANFIDEHSIHMWIEYVNIPKTQSETIYYELQSQSSSNTDVFGEWLMLNTRSEVRTVRTVSTVEEWINNLPDQCDRMLGRLETSFIRANPWNHFIHADVLADKLELCDYKNRSGQTFIPDTINNALYEYGEPESYNYKVHFTTLESIIKYLDFDIGGDQYSFYNQFLRRYGQLNFKGTSLSNAKSIIKKESLRSIFDLVEFESELQKDILEVDTSIYPFEANVEYKSLCIDLNYAHADAWINQKRVFSMFQPDENIPFVKLGTHDNEPLFKVHVNGIKNTKAQVLDKWTQKTHKDFTTGQQTSFIGIRFQVNVEAVYNLFFDVESPAELESNYFQYLLLQNGKIQFQGRLPDKISSVEELMPDKVSSIEELMRTDRTHVPFIQKIVLAGKLLANKLNELPLSHDYSVLKTINLPDPNNPSSWRLRNLNLTLSMKFGRETLGELSSFELYLRKRGYTPSFFAIYDNSPEKIGMQYMKCSQLYKVPERTVKEWLENLNPKENENAIHETLCLDCSEIKNLPSSSSDESYPGISINKCSIVNDFFLFDVQGIHSFLCDHGKWLVSNH